MQISKCWISKPLSYEEPIHLDNVSVFSHVVIGRRSYMNDGIIREDVTIGRYCSIGRRCTIGASRHPTEWLSTHPFVFAPEFRGRDISFPNRRTNIANDVWIGDNVVIVAGVNIGNGAVIGAGSVVTRDVDPYAIVGGVPARLIRLRFAEDTIYRLLKLEWWYMDEEKLKGAPFTNVDECIQQLERIDDGYREPPCLVDYA